MKYEEYTNKMQWLMLAFVVVLFVALTPGVLLRYGRREGMDNTHTCPNGKKQQEDGSCV